MLLRIVVRIIMNFVVMFVKISVDKLFDFAIVGSRRNSYELATDR